MQLGLCSSRRWQSDILTHSLVLLLSVSVTVRVTTDIPLTTTLRASRSLLDCTYWYRSVYRIADKRKSHVLWKCFLQQKDKLNCLSVPCDSPCWPLHPRRNLSACGTLGDLALYIYRHNNALNNNLLVFFTYLILFQKYSHTFVKI